MINSGLGVGVCCVGSGEGEVEVASWVLWLDGASDGEAGTIEHLQSLLLALGNPVHGGYKGDDWLKQQICNKMKTQRKSDYFKVKEIQLFESKSQKSTQILRMLFRKHFV